MRILDVATFSGEYDRWFFDLEKYVEAVQNAVIKESTGQLPTEQTLKKLDEADKRHDPIKIFLDLETAIRMEFFDFKKIWDELLP